MVRPPLQLLFLIRHPYQSGSRTLGGWQVAGGWLWIQSSLVLSANLQGPPGSLFYLAEPAARLPNPALGHVHTLSCPPLGVIILASHRTPLLSAASRTLELVSQTSWSCLGRTQGPEGEKRTLLWVPVTVSAIKGCMETTVSTVTI